MTNNYTSLLEKTLKSLDRSIPEDVENSQLYRGYSQAIKGAEQQPPIGFFNFFKKCDYNFGYFLGEKERIKQETRKEEKLEITGLVNRVKENITSQIQEQDTLYQRELEQKVEQERICQNELNQKREKNRIYKAKRRAEYVPVEVISFSQLDKKDAAYVASYSTNPEITFTNNDLKEKLHVALSTLKKREAEVLRLYYGINQERRYNTVEIGRMLGLTSASISDIKIKAIRQLQLRSILGIN
jgi:DNA-directed RNA polymerase specialized sigma subunit